MADFLNVIQQHGDSAGEIFVRTTALRYSKEGVLQQGWQEYQTGRVEWRDVPKEPEGQ